MQGSEKAAWVWDEEPCWEWGGGGGVIPGKGRGYYEGWREVMRSPSCVISGQAVSVNSK